ncbi:uncharacterized protein ALTATR162_LOCUS7540 [Alternaria atra]|uniref:Uncharacterized protein n=1 Tax=Alternaria atra TaxID=119953 RepID=A0A8J2N7N4_9PLEO|nr:uncharacterized protein ALTATR162_LOCUS7540 [Alternaria atra]CAG5172887.1 unnamed protein product [Alternaria atra]
MSPSLVAPSPPQQKPGLLLVNPRLRDPNPDNADTFLRWTKLHARDLLNVPDSGSGHVTHGLRFCAPDSDDRYSHAEEDETMPKYLYTFPVSDITFLKGEAYNGVSRKLNLEKTRELESGEEAVGFPEQGKDEAMVFDIVDAKFAVYEEVESAWLGSEDSFQKLPTHLTSRGGTGPKSVLVVVHVDLPQAHTTTGVEIVPEALRSSLLNLVKAAVPPALKPYSSLYRWSGVEAQPDHHPLISKDGRGNWMVLLLLVDEEGKTLIREHAAMLVQGWVQEERGKLGGGKIDFGVWDGEVLMG